MNLTSCTLSRNTAARLGGGIETASGTLNLSGCTLSGNSAAFRGGGIDALGGVYGCTLNLSGCTLTGNSAATGGGIYDDSGTTVTVKDSSSITGNTAPVGSGPDVLNQGVLDLDASSIIGILDGKQPS